MVVERASAWSFDLRPAMVERHGRTPRPPEGQKSHMVDRIVARIKSVPPQWCAGLHLWWPHTCNARARWLPTKVCKVERDGGSTFVGDHVVRPFALLTHPGKKPTLPTICFRSPVSGDRAVDHTVSHAEHRSATIHTTPTPHSCRWHCDSFSSSCAVKTQNP